MPARFLYARFVSGTQKAAVDWNHTVDEFARVYAGAAPERTVERVAMTPGPAVTWRLVSENRREIARACRLFTAEQHVRADIARLLRGIGALQVHTAPAPRLRSTGWFVTPVRGESRLILMTARGAPFVPSGVAYVDAKLEGTALPAGARQTTSATLPVEDKALATDTTTVWALVFALQFLLVAEAAAAWAFRRVGPQKTWIVFVPVLLLASVLVTDQLVRLLPNLL